MAYLLKQTALFVFLFITFNASAKFSLDRIGVVVDADEGESSITVTNNGTDEILLYSAESLEETKAISGQSLFYLSPPVSKIAPNESQIIRIILKEKYFTKEMLGRLTFQEVVAQKSFKNKTVFSAAYNIAALVRPIGLANNNEPWKLLYLTNEGGQTFIKNNSNYVVRLVPSLNIKLNTQVVDKLLNASYIMPGGKLKIGNYLLQDIQSVTIRPVSQSAIELPEYTINKKK